MKVENILEEFKLKEGIDVEKDTDYYDGLWGNSFRVNFQESQINTFKQRIQLIDKATEIEHQRLIADENSWAITGLRKIGDNWNLFDFDYGKEMLLNAFRFDLAYSSSERLPIEIAQKLCELITLDYKRENSYIYCNYNKSPWDKKSGGYSGWSLTDDWTFDLGIVLMNSNKLTFNYFLSED